MMGTVGYCWQQKVLHWLSALVILWTLVSGFSLALVAERQGWHEDVARANVALATLYLPLFLLRCWYRLMQPVLLAAGTSAWRHRAAAWVHGGMYWVTAIVLLSGVLMMARPIELFGWWSFGPLLQGSDWRHGWEQLHVAANLVLIPLVGLHLVGVALRHWEGRPVLSRMWF